MLAKPRLHHFTQRVSHYCSTMVLTKLRAFAAIGLHVVRMANKAMVMARASVSGIGIVL